MFFSTNKKLAVIKTSFEKQLLQQNKSGTGLENKIIQRKLTENSIKEKHQLLIAKIKLKDKLVN